MMEKIDINDTGVVDGIRNKMAVATVENKGLMPTDIMRFEARLSVSYSLAIYERTYMGGVSSSLLIGITAYGGGPVTSFLLTLFRSNDNSNGSPTVILNRIGGSPVPSTPRLKLLVNTTDGTFKIILEWTIYTPSVYVKLLSSYSTTYDKLPFIAASQNEVDAATYIEVTPV